MTWAHMARFDWFHHGVYRHCMLPSKARPRRRRYKGDYDTFGATRKTFDFRRRYLFLLMREAVRRKRRGRNYLENYR